MKAKTFFLLMALVASGCASNKTHLSAAAQLKNEQIQLQAYRDEIRVVASQLILLQASLTNRQEGYWNDKVRKVYGEELEIKDLERASQILRQACDQLIRQQTRLHEQYNYGDPF